MKKEISRDPSSTVENVVGTNRAGEALYTTQANPSYSTLLGLERARAAAVRQLAQLMANRHKVIKAKGSDSSEQKRRDRINAVLDTEATVSDTSKEKRTADIFSKHKDLKKKHDEKVSEDVEKMLGAKESKPSEEEKEEGGPPMSMEL